MKFWLFLIMDVVAYLCIGAVIVSCFAEAPIRPNRLCVCLFAYGVFSRILGTIDEHLENQ